MNMVVSKNYKIKEQNGMYYIVPSSVPGCPQCGGEMKIRDSKRRKVILRMVRWIHLFAAIQVYGVWACSSGTPGHYGFLISIIRGRRSSIR